MSSKISRSSVAYGWLQARVKIRWPTLALARIAVSGCFTLVSNRSDELSHDGEAGDMCEICSDPAQFLFGMFEIGDVAATVKHRPALDRHRFDVNQDGARLARLNGNVALDIANFPARSEIRAIEQPVPEKSADALERVHLVGGVAEDDVDVWANEGGSVRRRQSKKRRRRCW